MVQYWKTIGYNTANDIYYKLMNERVSPIMLSYTIMRHADTEAEIVDAMY